MDDKKKLITLTTDFAVQSQGVANMEAVILDIAPGVNVVNLTHGIADFDIRSGARVMEAVDYFPIGFHVCVVDPGVGTRRKPIIIQTKRGDYLIGPDNGVLISAANILGGAVKVVEITNTEYMINPISPIFHGRHIFAPAAAYLAKGVQIDNFGPILKFNSLQKAPYTEAVVAEGRIEAEVIHINKFGSTHLNILHSAWDQFNIKLGKTVKLTFGHQEIPLTFVETFGQVAVSKPLILKDDFSRMELALNQGSFADKYKIKVADKCVLNRFLKDSD